MTSDRDAFIAGIRANPDDDLRRLVFADWLEEHGEPERAEFIRLQIEAARQYPPLSNTPYDERARELLEAHASEWFGRLFRDLEPERSEPLVLFTHGQAGHHVYPHWQVGEKPNDPYYYCLNMVVQRGFGDRLTIDLAERPEKSSIGVALNAEPIRALTVRPVGSANHWKRFTEPELRHISVLDVTEETLGNTTSPTAVVPILSDSHLAGVRRFVYRFCRNIVSQPLPLPVAFVRNLESSPLGYRVNDLSLSLDDPGLSVLARSQWLRLEKLSAFGNLTSIGTTALNQARFAPTLRSLSLYNAQLDDEAVAALARASGFSKLVELDLSRNRLTDSGLRTLATARFLSQLEVLDLSKNPIPVQAHSPGLIALAEALNPDALRELRFQLNGYDQIPPCLAHLGSRVQLHPHVQSR